MRSRHDQLSHYVKVALALFWVLLVLPSTLMAGTVTLGSPSSSVVTEGPATTVSFPLTISGTIDDDFTLSYTVSGTNITPSDFTDITGTIELEEDDDLAPFCPRSLEIPPDGLVEEAETLVLTLNDNAPSDNVSGSGNVQIVNGDVGTVGLSVAGLSDAEGADLAFGLVLDNVATEDITVNYTVTSGTASGSDYTDTGSGTATITAGASTGTITIHLETDAIVEVDESFTVNLDSVTSAAGPVQVGGTTSATGTITNTTVGTVGLSVAGLSDAEGADLAFGLVLDNVATEDITVNYTVTSGTASGSDYTDTGSGTATITAGASTGTITIHLETDAIVEVDESFTVNLDSVTSAAGPVQVGGTTSATGTITNTTVGTVGLSVAGLSDAEGADLAFGLVLDNVATEDITVNYTVTSGTASGSDYTDTGSGTATITAGARRYDHDSSGDGCHRGG